VYIDRGACTEKTGVRFYRFAHGWEEIMNFGALATIGFTLVFGLPAASSFFVGIIVLTTPAQADIRCTRMGCRETGKTIRRNGSYYRGLGLPAGYHQANGTQPKQQAQPR
jgi:hypothetical protein